MRQMIDASRREATLSPTGTNSGTSELPCGFRGTLSTGGSVRDSRASVEVLPATWFVSRGVSDLVIPTNDNGITLELLPNEYSSQLREAVTPEQGLTSEETEADRALCAMLEIDPEQLATDRLEQLRQLWA